MGLARLVPQQEGNSRKTGDREGAQRRQNAEYKQPLGTRWLRLKCRYAVFHDGYPRHS